MLSTLPTESLKFPVALDGFPDIRPRHTIGYINPVLLSDFIHYQFYAIFPPDVQLVSYHLNLNRFTPEGVDEALQAFWPAVDFLINRKVERITLGGIPLSALAGRARITKFLEEARKKTDIPVTTDFEESIEALRFLGIKRVACAAKWDRPLMEAVRAYLADAGIEVVGTHGEAHTAQQVVALKAEESIEIAVNLARDAFAAMPEADGLLLAGGAWLVVQAIPIIENRFGKPVVNNPAATYWAGLRQCGLQSQVAGLGRLLDSTRA